jgi:hypothetical protein
VLQAEKDFNLESHPEIESVPNLHVIKLMQSFKSKELVTERFAWRHYYWCDDSSCRTHVVDFTTRFLRCYCNGSMGAAGEQQLLWWDKQQGGLTPEPAAAQQGQQPGMGAF